MSNFFQSLRNAFLAGLAVLIPAGVTLWALVTVTSVVDSVLDVLPPAVHPEVVLGRYLDMPDGVFPLPGLGISVALIIVLSVGTATRFYAGRKLVEFLEAIVFRVPLLSGVYQGLKKLVDTFTGESMRFRQVVMIEYPRRGAWAIAFLTGEAGYLDAARDFGQDQPVSVFLPTTPNPTSGFYLVLPRRDVRRLDISVEEAFKLIMSAGIVQPDELHELETVEVIQPADEEPTLDTDDDEAAK
ncbi:MAG TPA: DUF502 domain-containing protein [Myxococcota bacterium]|nr:DUF502 domain-containing protein [Myxococcota bacterium]